MTAVPSLPPRLNRKIGQAMGDWSMLAEGDKVLIGVSGGIDSLVNAWVLQHWRAKAPIDYELEAVLVDPGRHPADAEAGGGAARIGAQLGRHHIPFTVVQSRPPPADRGHSCFQCARDRRSLLFDLAREKGCTKLAFGHHKDDLVETFFLNVLYSGNISTMLPRQDLFDGKLSLIRVLAYLDKEEVVDLAGLAGLDPVTPACPLGGDSRRETVRAILAHIYGLVPGAKSSLFSALGNVRREYML